MDLLREIFRECLISKNSDFLCPPRSPGFNSTDFFMGYLKDKVYVNKPDTIRQLRQNIQDEILSLQPESLRDVMKNALKRVNLCIEKNGGY
ncbi:uncharacterized protein TNIN_136751 [Trichonephila inaurata madagascariensis]|uniref:Uncharacterized protein n=1 Tax=Trichonephila inaurata madagascariensis TaxID=2747483 RepID=A0A8X7C3J0_9ARAC|nr:uncharacterized protein TNIN_136751 [Trichonephila inaurata madagascariensis]